MSEAKIDGDNGRIKIYHYKTSIVCEVYKSCELLVEDYQWILKSLDKVPSFPSKFIVNSIVSYAVSTQAQQFIRENFSGIDTIAFVVSGNRKAADAEYKKSSYLKNKNVELFYSMLDAHDWLSQSN